MTPSPTPTVRIRMEAPAARDNVAGNRSASVDVTDSWFTKEYPRQGAAHQVAPKCRPAKIPRRNCQYWLSSGRSTPRLWRIAARVCGVQVLPQDSRAGSEGRAKNR